VPAPGTTTPAGGSRRAVGVGVGRVSCPGEPLDHQLGGLGGVHRDGDPVALEDLLLLGGGLAARAAFLDDGAGVAHLLALGRLEAGDVADDRRVRDVVADPLAGELLLGPADLADERDRVGVGIRRERLDHVEELRADDRVTADPDAGGDADPGLRQLVHDLVGQGAGPADQPDVARHRDVGRDDADVGLPGRDHPGAVRPDQPDAATPHDGVVDLGHVVDRDPFGDGDDGLDPGLVGLEDRVLGERGGDHHHRGVGAGRLDRLLDGGVTGTSSSSQVVPPFFGWMPATTFVP
jgi:hypothetical protein